MDIKILSVLCLAATSALAINTASAKDDVYNRAAVGNITVRGGASRIHGDMKNMYAAELALANKTHAKNVMNNPGLITPSVRTMETAIPV